MVHSLPLPRRKAYPVLFLLAAWALYPCAAHAEVLLAAPVNGSTVSGSINISAQVGSGVQWVDFYIDGKYLVSSPPYAIQWNSATVSDGTHTISVAAFGAGDSGQGSAAIKVTVANHQSQLAMSAPANGSTVSGTVAIDLQPGNQVQWADFYVDGNYLTSSPPYDIQWNSQSVANGTHIISATAFGANDTAVGSAAAQVTVTNGSQPQVAITAPVNGSTVSGAVAVDVAAGNQVQWVNLYVDGAYLASSPPYQFTWNTAGTAAGAHTISVKAYNSNDSVVGAQAIGVTLALAATPKSSATPQPRPTPKPATATPAATPAVISSGPSYLATLGTLPPGSPLPSDADCAKAISYSSWEPRPNNHTANQTVPDPAWLTNYYATVASGEGGAPGSYLQRVDGDFTGTTDEILQWAACKWGFDANVVRAIAVNESWWDQDSVNSNGPTYGILQIKVSAGNYPSTVPYAQQSTAFNADYKLAQQRACFDGKISYLDSSSYPKLSNTNYMLWGCVGQWYSGEWYDSGAKTYISQVQSYLQQQTWAQSGF